MPGLAVSCAHTALSKTLTAQRIVQPGMLCSWMACPVGLAAIYIAVGSLGLGVAGAAAAASLRDLLQLLALAALAARYPEFRACWAGGICDRRVLRGWGGYLRLGLPSLIICCVRWATARARMHAG